MVSLCLHVGSFGKLGVKQFMSLYLCKWIAFFRDIPDLMLLFTPKAISRPNDRLSLQVFHLPVLEVCKWQGQWLCWAPPPPGQFKLNMDGSFINDFCAGSGIIWDSNGQMVRAFLTFYGEGTNMYAEILALQDGLQMCRTLALGLVIVETDLLVSVRVIKNDYAIPLMYKYEL